MADRSYMRLGDEGRSNVELYLGVGFIAFVVVVIVTMVLLAKFGIVGATPTDEGSANNGNTPVVGMAESG